MFLQLRLAPSIRLGIPNTGRKKQQLMLLI